MALRKEGAGTVRTLQMDVTDLLSWRKSRGTRSSNVEPAPEAMALGDSVNTRIDGQQRGI